MKLEFIKGEKINTYKVTYNKEKIDKLKKELKDYSIKNEIEIRYDCTIDNLDIYIKRNIDCDEYIELEFFTKKKSELDDTMNIPFSTPLYINKKIEIINFPLLYNVLFGKHKNENKNILKTLILYLEDEEGIKTKEGSYFHKNFFPNIIMDYIYDSNIPMNQKILFVEKIINSLEFKLEKSELLSDIDNQVRVISGVSAGYSKNKLLKDINKRLEIANENSHNLDRILTYISSDRKIKQQLKKKILVK